MFPVIYSVAETLEGYTTLRKLADSPDHVVPGHDPKILQYYPAARAEWKDWIVRLDVAPTVR